MRRLRLRGLPLEPGRWRRRHRPGSRGRPRKRSLRIQQLADEPGEVMPLKRFSEPPTDLVAPDLAEIDRPSGHRAGRRRVAGWRARGELSSMRRLSIVWPGLYLNGARRVMQRGGAKPGMATNDEGVEAAPLAPRQVNVALPAHTDCHAPATLLSCPVAGVAARAKALIVGSGSNQSAVDVPKPPRRSTCHGGRSASRGCGTRCVLWSDPIRNWPRHDK